ncbi:MAG: glycerate kinase type-2 family protein [Acidobacteriota bacterium]
MNSGHLKSVMREIYEAALAAVEPERSVSKFLKVEGDRLLAGERTYDLRAFRRIFLIGAGKAGVPMARAVENALQERLEAGLIVVKYGHGGSLRKTQALEAGHPEPDQAGLNASERILSFLQENLSEQDLLLVVISGGGSALLPAPVPEISFADKQRTTSVLLRSGADIHELNAMRKHLSRIKGGRLLRFTRGARVISMLLSDVVGDRPASIASGPTAPDPSTFEDCRQIIRKYGIQEDLPGSVIACLSEVKPEKETVKPGDPLLERVQNGIVASNLVGLQAAARKAESLGFSPLILSSSVEGNTEDVARVHVALAREVIQSRNPIAPPCCLISGGETTVRVTGSGKGGRNQEFALWCALGCAGWEKRPLLFASLGSDGTDGPTDAAGACASPETAEQAARLGLSIRDFLQRNDSYHFFEALGDLIVSGPTQTNVMDFRLVLMKA